MKSPACVPERTAARSSCTEDEEEAEEDEEEEGGEKGKDVEGVCSMLNTLLIA